MLFVKKEIMYKLDILQIVFNGIDGDSFQGDIALDHIMLFSGECGKSKVERLTVLIFL